MKKLKKHLKKNGLLLEVREEYLKPLSEVKHSTNEELMTYHNVESIHEFEWGSTLIKDSELGNIFIKTQDIRSIRTNPEGLYIMEVSEVKQNEKQ